MAQLQDYRGSGAGSASKSQGFEISSHQTRTKKSLGGISIIIDIFNISDISKSWVRARKSTDIGSPRDAPRSLPNASPSVPEWTRALVDLGKNRNPGVRCDSDGARLDFRLVKISDFHHPETHHKRVSEGVPHPRRSTQNTFLVRRDTGKIRLVSFERFDL